MENNETTIEEGREGDIRMITLIEKGKDGQNMTYRVFNKVGKYEDIYIAAIDAVQLSTFFGANECYNIIVNDNGKHKIWKRKLESNNVEYFLRDEVKPK
jgi:hypothetical protein